MGFLSPKHNADLSTDPPNPNPYVTLLGHTINIHNTLGVGRVYCLIAFTSLNITVIPRMPSFLVVKPQAAFVKI